MFKCLKNADWKKTGIFAAGVAFGTAGIKALSSNDAKKLYTNLTAAALRAKECVMQTVTKVQENAGDIYEEAKQINEERAAKEAVYDDEDLKEVEEVEAEAETEETEAVIFTTRSILMESRQVSRTERSLKRRSRMELIIWFLRQKRVIKQSLKMQ